MFHRNKGNHPANSNSSSGRGRGGLGGLFHRGGGGGGRNNTPTYQNNPQGYVRDPYWEGSTRSDWDHYAVRHEEALIGDPLPIMNNNLNLASRGYNNGAQGPYGNGPLANGPLNHGYDDAHYNKRHPVPNNYDRYGNPLIGPVTANGPLAGNYSSGTVVERNLLRGPGRRTRTGYVDDNQHLGGQQWGSAAWGSAPLYDSRDGGWGSQPLYGYRDARDVATPLLPDNPWTHNELGRDYSDGYRRGTIPYSSINNTFVNPPIMENFSNYGPHGELIEGTRTRVIREEIVPAPFNAAKPLGQSSTSTTTVKTVTTDIPISHDPRSEAISVRPGVVVVDQVSNVGGSTVVTETPVRVL